MYQERLENKLEEREVESWDELSSLVQEVAVEVVGYKEPQQPQKVKDCEIEKMSAEQREIHLEMMKEKDAGRVIQLRMERKRIARQIQKKLKQIRESEIDKIVGEIEELKDDAKMFRAVRNMKNRKFENPTVHDAEGKNVTTPDQAYQIVEDYFKKQFHQPNEISIERFVGVPKPLQNPLTGIQRYTR